MSSCSDHRFMGKMEVNNNKRYLRVRGAKQRMLILHFQILGDCDILSGWLQQCPVIIQAIEVGNWLRSIT